MFDHDTTANDAVSRRNVLRIAGGLIAGSTALAGLGAGRGAAETEEGLQVVTAGRILDDEPVFAVEVAIPEAVYPNDIEFPHDVVLGAPTSS